MPDLIRFDNEKLFILFLLRYFVGLGYFNKDVRL